MKSAPKRKRFLGWWVVGLLLSVAVSCTPENPVSEEARRHGKLYIVTTTGILRDAVAHVAGDRAEVEALMGPGVDPHLYKAALGDLQKLRQADIIIYNGLHLEGKMGEVLEKLARQKNVWAATDALPEKSLRKTPAFADSHDPHVWFDVQLWSQLVEGLAQKLKRFDAAHAQTYQTNAQQYRLQLDSLHRWTKNKISSIPAQQRILITAHDAFGYFGRAYGIDVRGLQGISTVSEFGLQDVSGLVNFIVNRKVKAVFVETSISQKAIEAVLEGARQKGHKVKLGGSLYSDALGEAGGPAGSYVGMVQTNVKTVVTALK
ncbi:metal ABC transporter solute-binding protein, Zn/Mn family [Rufibacter quisquiliarum]|uniref:Manganese/zinc/iron transport system substrate-binding protein n=1 Tax=Rufibacter quisquiliarum TaxID=1549639 RepID=A0A839GIP3_9BACT|nr:zinc ABC transporter substrate-binding protein [Rufibacter quisquiliarum]MBA9078732.1 manganese/zinc/iron transport system substrate-binding protein [Rufibacter quisquiliarum]